MRTIRHYRYGGTFSHHLLPGQEVTRTEGSAMSISRLTTIAAARFDAEPVSRLKTGVSSSKNDDSSKPASAADLIVALVPTEVIAIYTVFVTGILALIPEDAEGWDERHLLLRFVALLVMIALVITLVIVGFATKRSAQDKRKFPFAEAFGATAAALTWGLTTPGSPFLEVYPEGSFYDGALPLMIALVGGGLLTAFASQLKVPTK